MWAIQGNKRVGGIVRDGELLTFDNLKTRPDLSNSYCFCYLTLWHTFQIQFCELVIEAQPSALESVLQDVDFICGLQRNV